MKRLKNLNIWNKFVLQNILNGCTKPERASIYLFAFLNTVHIYGVSCKSEQK